jgi:hypothetical protein
MRDVVAALVALALVFFALSLLTTLHVYRKRQRRAREEELARGRTIIVELPTDPDLTLFTEDAHHFYYGARAIPKDEITGARVLINGAPIAAFTSSHWRTDDRSDRHAAAGPASFDDRPEGIARDRWDVDIETVNGAVRVECGAIRERVSQELARKIFTAVYHSVSG